MREEKRKLICRVGFLAICLLPTAVQLGSIFGAKVGARLVQGEQPDSDLNNLIHCSVNLADSSGAKITRFDNPSAKSPSKSLAENWAVRQSIHAPEVENSLSRIRLHPPNLPANHPLNRVPFDVVTIIESDAEFSIAIEKLTVEQQKLDSILLAFLSEEFHSIWQVQKQNSIEIDELRILKSTGAGNQSGEGRVTNGQSDNSLGKETLVLRGVTVSILDQAFDRVRISGRLVSGNSDLLDAIEFPFRCDVGREGRSSIVELDGRGFPIWFLQPAISRRLGPAAELVGKFKQVQIPNQPTITEVSGSLVNVDCGLISTALSPNNHPFLTGRCMIQNLTARMTGASVISLRGDFQSTSTGQVTADIAPALGRSVNWLGGGAVEPYRSFLILVSLTKEQLNIRSKYPGRHLIWNEQGADLLVSSQ